MLSFPLAIIAFITGIIFLYKSSDILVDGTTRTAAHFGVSSLIISVVIVAFGTSAPEFAISVGASIQEFVGNVDQGAAISVGNIIGSCIANLLLVIGISALIRPISIKKGIIKREFPIVFLVTVILLFFGIIGLFDKYHFWGGFVFIIVFCWFIWFFIKCAKIERIKTKRFKQGNTIKNIIFILIGIAGVVLGAWFLIESAITLADFFGIPPLIISLSMVAIGTSLPELVVSAMASYKNESDIALGNVLRSNVFNILLILGVSALFIPLRIIDAMDHLVLLILVTLFMIPILFTNATVSRLKGIILIMIYCGYLWYTFYGSMVFF
jgi:cation:H+ antiporter